MKILLQYRYHYISRPIYNANAKDIFGSSMHVLEDTRTNYLDWILHTWYQWTTLYEGSICFDTKLNWIIITSSFISLTDLYLWMLNINLLEELAKHNVIMLLSSGIIWFSQFLLTTICGKDHCLLFVYRLNP